MTTTHLFQEDARLVSTRSITETVYELVLHAPEIAAAARPGQFVHLEVTPLPYPLLRRPISIAGTRPERGELVLLVREAGLGTTLLRGREPGDTVGLLGPVGRPWSTVPSELPLFLVAGGIGLAPLLFLSARIGERSAPTCFLFGARNRAEVPRDLLRGLPGLAIATDDGSLGYHGYVTDLLLQKLSELKAIEGRIVACGPEPMLESLLDKTRDLDFEVELSLENRMACGVGACYGCAVATLDGMRRVCVDGPVFNAEELGWKLPPTVNSR